MGGNDNNALTLNLWSTITVTAEVVDSMVGIPKETKELLKIYPNARSGELVVLLNELSLESIKRVYFTNQLGQVFTADYSVHNSESISIDLSKIDGGVYFLQLQIDDARSYTTRFVKTHWDITFTVIV